MRIIDRLLFTEILKTLLVIVVSLVVVLLANTLVRQLANAAVGALSADILMLVVGLEVLRAMGLIIPPAFFFAVLWVLGRMYRDNEMVALASAGFGHAGVYRAVLLAALPVTLLVGVMALEILPWARGYVTELKAGQADSADLHWVRAGRFNEFSRGGLVVYTERLSADGSRLSGVFVQDRQQGRLGLVTADSAYQTTDPETGERFVVLTNGRRYEGLPGQLDYALGRFDEYAVRIPEVEIATYQLPISAKPWRNLVGADDLRDRAELQYRLSVPLALLAFAVLAVPLARSTPRSGVYGRLAVALLLYFAFLNLQRLAERWMEDAVMPAWLGLWWVPLLMVGVAALVTALDSNRFAAWRRGVRVGRT